MQRSPHGEPLTHHQSLPRSELEVVLGVAAQARARVGCEALPVGMHRTLQEATVLVPRLGELCVAELEPGPRTPWIGQCIVVQRPAIMTFGLRIAAQTEVR